MLAHLMLTLAMSSGFAYVKIPFADMQACETFMADPAPMVVIGPAIPLEARCVNEMTIKPDPGKPV